MNLQATKLSLIEWLLSLQDEVILSKLDQLRAMTKSDKGKIKPMSLDAFFAKIEASDIALKKGQVINHHDLRKEVKSWGKK